MAETISLNRVKLIKANIDLIDSGLRPIQDDRVKVTILAGEEKVRAEADDYGVVARVEVAASDIKLVDKKAKDFSFFISKKVLSNVISVTKEELVIETDGEEISFISDGTVLNMQLTNFNIEIDSSFETDAKKVIIETKSADYLKEMTNRMAVSAPSGKAAIAVMSIGSDIRYGSSINFTIYKSGFEKIQVNVTNRFMSFISNITKFGLNVDFIWDAVQNSLIIRNDNIAYKTKEIDADFPDIDKLIDGVTPEAEVTLGVAGVTGSLNKLSIPLIGMQEKVINIKIDENSKTQLKVHVTDVSNKESHDFWAAVKPTGLTEVRLFLDDFKDVASVMGESFGVAVFEKCTELSDEVQRTYLVNSII